MRPVLPPRPAGPCIVAGAWIRPATGETWRHDEVLARASTSRVVLLGERHDVPEDHRWQLDVLAGLLARRGRLVVGFEAFPRAAQPTLDAWARGERSVDALLAGTRWKETAGLPADPLMPLLHFTRRHRLPTVGLNVSRALVAKVGRRGWRVIPAHEREGVGDPAPAPAGYVERLRTSYAEHACRTPAAVAGTPELARFIEAQLLWDRGMAEALVRALDAHGGALVAGLVGSGHLEHGSGIPHQLAALGVEDVTVLLPWDVGQDCRTLERGVADFVFGVAPLAAETPPPTRHRCPPPAAQPPPR